MPAHTRPTPLVAQTLEPGELVDEAQAAAILRVGRHTLQNWRWRGCGPHWHRVGLRMVRYARTDLAAFVEGKADEQ